jgi:hypothetical protein
MEPFTKVSILRITSRGRVLIPGTMDAPTLASGSTIKCTVRESSLGKMDANIVDNMRRIRKSATAFTSGPMDVNLKATGPMDASTDSAFISPKVGPLKKENGEMARGTQQPKIKTVDAPKKPRLPILVESLHFLKLFSYITYNY